MLLQQFVVIVNGVAHSVTPTTAITEHKSTKQKQFWFYLDGKALLAVQDSERKYRWVAEVEQPRRRWQYTFAA